MVHLTFLESVVYTFLLSAAVFLKLVKKRPFTAAITLILTVTMLCFTLDVYIAPDLSVANTVAHLKG